MTGACPYVLPLLCIAPEGGAGGWSLPVGFIEEGCSNLGKAS